MAVSALKTHLWSDFVRSLPSTDDPHYFQSVTNFVTSDDVEDCLLQGVSDESCTFELRFASFYGLLVISRRRKNFSRFRELIERYYAAFRSEPVVDVLKAESLSFCGDVAELEEARRLVRAAIVKCDQAATRLTAASVCLRLFKAGGEKTTRTLEEASEHIEIALSLQPNHPKALSIRAKILANQDRFQSAYDDIDRAIDLEDSSRLDYPIRIMDHQMAKLEITILDHSNRLERAQEAVSEEIGSSRRSLLETLGLLAAVIAFLTTSAAIGSSLPFQEAVRFSIVSAGAILLVFVGFSLLISRSQEWVRLAVALVLAFSMCLVPALVR